VIVVDANLLLYAYDSAATQHAKARAWLEETFSNPAPIGLSLETVCAFLRIVTHPGIPGKRLSVEDALAIVDSWFARPNIRLLSPGENSWPLLRQTISTGQARGALVSDAELAALTIGAGGVLYTADRDFARFPGLRWINPLAK
jgi:toxin-antitoxin system PIN domain toxin